MEVEVIQAIWHDGKPIFPKDGESRPVIELPTSEAVYLHGLGRVRIIAADEAPAEAKPARQRKAKAD